LTLAAGEMSGTLTLEEPKQTLRISLTRSDGDDDGDNGPVGVIGALGERLTLGDVVLDDDATINDDEEEEEEEQQQRGMRERERAPRYGGVSSYEWSPTVNEMLLSSEGDVYRLQIDEEKWDAPIDDEGDGKAPVEVYRGDLTRLTRTRDPEFSVQFLPDGTGYTYLRSGALIRVGFEGSMIEQLDPELEDGEEMVDYAISPDGKRLVFLASRGGNFWGVGRTVNIVNYRDRFAQVRQVPRHMPDDPFPEAYSSVYLYDLDGHDREEGTLKRVFTRRVSGPRDIMDVPHWAPDSTKVAFAAFDQASGLVKVMEAGFEEMEEDKDAGADDEAAPDDAEDADTEKDDTEKNDTEKDDTEKDDTEKDDDVDDEEKAEGDESAEEPEQPDFEIVDARVVYQFLHAGGPNTPGMVVPQYLPDSLRMVLITELSGFRQLHVLDPRYEQLSQLTEGRFEVYPFDLSEDHTTLFATATMDDPAQEHVFKIDLENGELTRLSVEEGVYASVGVSDDGAALLAMRSDFGAPSELVAVDGAAQSTTTLTDSHPEEAHKLTTVSPEYFTFDNRHGLQIHGHMFKPEDWTPEDKRPLLIYVYGGPLGERKMATRGSYSAPSYYFARYMTEVHGWVTATIDPRGASGYGAVFEKANFEQVGKPQTEDLVDGAKWLVEHAGVDPAKKALHGWSFGGFQTQMVMYTEPDAFAVGIAGAGPTEWHNYNSWYSTGTIGPNQPGKTDLEEYSLLPLAKNLKGKLLLVHGVEDSNVLYQDTMRVYRELLKAGKETLVELFIDPTGGHGLGGDVKTFNRYHKYEDFLLRNLGKGASAAEPEEGDEEKDEPDEDE
jgi:dipeptidyl aminopeptidase/acylaminoacyl peptidase